MRIRIASKSDEAKIAQLHFSSGVQGLLSKLSIKTLRHNFYSPILTDVKNVCFVAEEDTRIIGFLFYRNDVCRTKFDLPVRNFRLIFDLAKAVCKNPMILIIAFNVIRTERKTLKLLKKRTISTGELQVLVVDRAFQNRGIGKELILTLSKIDDVKRIVVKTQSDKAKGFYRDIGFVSLLDSRFLSSKIYVLTKEVNL